MTRIIERIDVGRGPQTQECYHRSRGRAGRLFFLTVSLFVLSSTALPPKVFAGLSRL